MSSALFLNISKDGNFLDICWRVRYRVKYGTKRKKENNNQEIRLKQDIENIEKSINNTLCNIKLDDLKQELDVKKTELN